MASRGATRGHLRAERRRRTHFRMDTDFRRARNHHLRPRVTVQLRGFSTVDENLGDQDRHDDSLPSRIQRDGRALPSQAEGGSDSPWNGRAPSMVLAPSVRHVGDPDDGEAGYIGVSSGLGFWRGTRGPRGTTSFSASNRRPTRASTRIRARRSAPRGVETAADGNLGPSASSRPPAR